MTEDIMTVDTAPEVAEGEEDVEYTENQATEAEDYTKKDADDYIEAEAEDAGIDTAEDEISYQDDLCELAGMFSELENLSDIERIREYEKYKHFRALGLSPKEAYLATGEPQPKRRAAPTSPISVRRPGGAMPESELRMAREIFSDLSDREITILYRMVTK